MKPIDFRNETWEEIQGRVDGLRHEVWSRMLAAPGLAEGTTREWAEYMDMDLLTLRPRITELYELGFVECVGRNGREGVYRARSAFVARQHYDKAARDARQSQLELKL